MPEPVAPSAFARSQESKICQLPNELLDIIIHTVYSFQFFPIHRCMPEKNHWLACALVCRRWYEITLPHLFRAITISPDSPGDAYDFYEFLTNRPPIASLVEAIFFFSLDLHMWIVAATVKLLPRLQCLDLTSVDLQRKAGGKPLCGDRKLERLVYSSCARHATYRSIPDHGWRKAIDLLALFSEIEEFSMSKGI